MHYALQVWEQLLLFVSLLGIFLHLAVLTTFIFLVKQYEKIPERFQQLRGKEAHSQLKHSPSLGVHAN